MKYIPSLRFAVFTVVVLTAGGVAFQSARSTAASGGATPTTEASTSATVGEDGTVAVTGITLPGQSVELPTVCADAESQTAKVVCAAEAFLATLSEEQQADVVLDATQENTTAWSNLPTTFVQRNGIALSTLSSEQRDAALAMVKAATGSLPDNGYSEVTQILMADDVLNVSGGMQGGFLGSGGMPSGGMPPGGGPDGGPPPGAFSGGMGAGSGGAGRSSGGSSDYASGAYYLAFFGTPSMTDTWILQFGGHHLAINTTYKAGEVASATPEFRGVEPLVWTTEDATYAPLADEHQGMVAMLARLSDEQLATAELSETFIDVLMGPGQDGRSLKRRSVSR